MGPEETYHALERNLASADREFSRVFKIYADRMQCCKGCSIIKSGRHFDYLQELF